jgi:hypothetical protein
VPSSDAAATARGCPGQTGKMNQGASVQCDLKIVFVKPVNEGAQSTARPRGDLECAYS